METLAETHFELAELAEAEAIQLDVTKNSDLVRCRLSLADTYIAMHRHAEAELIYENLITNDRTKDVRTQILIMGEKARLYIAADRAQEAERLYDDILRYAEKATAHQEQIFKFTPQNRRDYGPSVKMTIAACYMAQERYAEAKELYESLLKNEKYSDNWNIRYNLARIYESESRDKLALTYYKRSLALTEEQHGSIHPEVAKQLEALAVFYIRRNQLLQASPPKKRALSIYQSAYGSSHPLHIESIQRFERLYRSLGHVGWADELEEMLQEIQSSIPK